MRMFFASWPPAGVAEALARWAQAARRDCGGRVTRADRIHLTLAFLGEVDPEEARATAAAVRLPACAFSIEQARYWAQIGDVERAAEWVRIMDERGYRDPRILRDGGFAPVRSHPAFQALAAKIREASGLR